MLGAVLGTLLVGGVAFATTSTFMLGATNSPDALTAVTAQNKDGHGGLNGPMIKLTNPSTGSSATALGLTAGSGRPPFTTNSNARVPNLNADLLDGVDSSSFMKGGGQFFTGKVQVVPGDLNVALIHHLATPAFTTDVYCDDDPTFGGGISFDVTGSADMVMEGPGASSNSNPGGSGMGGSMPNGSSVRIGAGWTNGHMVTMWVTLLTRSGSADPRDDGCYFELQGVVK
jgi:hypothetical protein